LGSGWVRVEVRAKVRVRGHLGEEEWEGGAASLLLQHDALRVEDRHLEWWWGGAGAVGGVLEVAGWARGDVQAGCRLQA
jgi:hypothetical protein